MGGGISKINYECDPFVAKFIQENAYHLSELKSIIQDDADLDPISNTDANGVVILTPKQSTVDENEVRKKLDEFFEKFLSFEESFDPTKLPYYQQSSLSDFSNCSVTWKRNSVRITGNTADVKQLVAKIREAENPPPQHFPPSLARSIVNNNVPIQSNSTYYRNLSSSPKNKAISSQNNSSATNETSSGIKAPTPSFISSPQSTSTTAMGLSATNTALHQTSTLIASTLTPPKPNTTTPSLPKGTTVIPALRTPSPTPTIDLEPYVMRAPQFPVARFIKYSRCEMQKLYDAMINPPISNIEIEENSEKKIEYICSPIYQHSMQSQNEYDEKCRKKLLEYLSAYNSIIRTFKAEHVQAVRSQLRQQSRHEDRIVFVRWHFDDNKVIIAGPKALVKEKLDDIYLILGVPRPDKCPKVNISTKDPDIAEFIQRWPQYRLVLSDIAEDVAEVKINFKQKNFQFCSIYEMEEDEVPYFKDQCTAVLEDFASQFSKWSITVPVPVLQKAKRAQPGIFSQDENVCVSVCKDFLLVVGLTHDLEARKTELLNAIQTASKRILKCSIPAPDCHVAYFIMHSNQTMLAFVEFCGKMTIAAKVQINQGKNDTVDYQFSSIAKMLPEETELFKNQCKMSLDHFLTDLTSWEEFYPPEIIQLAMQNGCVSFNNPTFCQKVFQDKIVLVGKKDIVTRNTGEIGKKMEQFKNIYCKRYRYIYKFSYTVPPMENNTAVFITKSRKHSQGLQSYLSHIAKVHLLKDKAMMIHFTSIGPVLPDNIPQFENDCVNEAQKFFNQFSQWQSNRLPDKVMAAIRGNPILRTDKADICVDVVDNVVIVSGLKKEVEEIRPKLQELLKTNGSSSKDLGTGTEGNPTLSFFFYPPGKNSQNIIQYIFITPQHLNALKKQVGMEIAMERHPTEKNPKCIKITTKENESKANVQKRVRPVLVRFFGKFQAVYQSFSPKEIGHTRQVVSCLVKDFNSSRLSVSWNRNTLCIVGLTSDVQKLTAAIANANEKATTEKGAKDMPSANEQQKSLVFGPKPTEKNSKDLIQYVFNTPQHLNALKIQVGPATIIARYPDIKNPLFIKVTAATNRLEQDAATVRDFFGKFEVFTKSFSPDFIRSARQTNSSLFETSTYPTMSVTWKGNTVLIVGLIDVVNIASLAIEDAIEKVKRVTVEENFEPAQLRYLTKCGVVDNVSLKYNGVVTVTRGNNTLKFSGTSQKVQEAVKLLKDTSFIKKIPEIKADEIKLLIKALKGEFKEQNCFDTAQIDDQFLQQEITGLVELEDDKVFLVTLTEDMFLKASSFLGSLFVTYPLKLPENSNDFKPESICEVLSSFPQCYIVSFTDSLIELTTFDKEMATKLREKVQDHLDGFAIDSYVIKCSEGDARFILKHWIKGGEVPSSIDGKLVKEGVECKGPSAKLNSAVQQLKKRNLCCYNFVYSTPMLSTLLSEIKWKAFVTFLETNNRCTITANVDSTLLQQSSRFNDREKELSQLQTKSEAEFGNITVKVVVGDITADMSGAIINGATSHFNLSKGVLSSAILKRAGLEMQKQCDTNPKFVHPRVNPYIKVTKGFNLLCDYVVHMVTPSTAAELGTRLKNALDVADLMKVKSVAVPTLGAGGIGLETDKVAAAMFDAFHEFVETNPSSVREIRVVVFESTILDIFKTNITVAQGLMNYLESYSSVVSTLVPKVEDVTVLLVCDEPTCLDEVKTVISDEMDKIIITKTISDDVIAQMTDHDRIGILDAASDCPVTVDFQQNSIILRGLAENVNKVSDTVREMIYQLKDCLEKLKSVSWKWSFGGNKFHPLPARVSGELEAKRKIGAVHMVTVFGHSLKVKNGKCELSGIKGRLERVSGNKQDNHGLPSQWKDMGGDRWKKVELPHHTVEFQNIFKLFHKSSPVATIRKIERIQNPKLYKHYELNKSDVKEHMKSAEPVERELFHGTSQQDAEKICGDGFDRNFAGKNATVYGKGSYFALNSSYSVNYARNSGSSTCCVFLANVITGDFCQGNQYMKAPDVKPGSNGRLYDSAVDSLSNPSIFIAFRDANVYPTYLITFI